MSIREFKIRIPDEQLNDLSSRLKNTKWAYQMLDNEWKLGTNSHYLKSLVTYWTNFYNWREQEQILNQYPQYKCKIDDVDIHFFHIKGKEKNSTPLILSHGWPDSFIRYQKIIPLLTDPVSYGGKTSDSFDLIIPSLPGFGFSTMSELKGINNNMIADLWAKLMIDELGYSKFGAAGGDMGSGITRYLAQKYSEYLIGIHLTDVGIIRSIILSEDSKLSEEEKEYKRSSQNWIANEGAYMSIQSTKPQTLSYGLSDSPVGLAAWIIEKFYSWSDIGDNFEAKYSMDELLNNISIYWFTNSIASTIRMYHENTNTLPPLSRIEVPTALALFRKDILPPPKEWVENNYNLKQWTEIPKGGHFTAFEEPILFSDDVRKFFHALK